MRLLDLTLPTPAENLALEEALMDSADAHGEVLRLWESPVHFVVLGAGCRLERDVKQVECDRLEIPVLRRCSGGGTVLQGPGCLNFTAVLDMEARPEVRTIDGTTRLVLGKALCALADCGLTPEIQGTSDLALNGVKFGGNAQRRKKRFVLFHGTVLHQFDLGLVSACLHEPEKQPEYRRNRAHAAFINNVAVDSDSLKVALAKAWETTASLEEWPEAEMRNLLPRYKDPAWTNRL